MISPPPPVSFFKLGLSSSPPRLAVLVWTSPCPPPQRRETYPPCHFCRPPNTRTPPPLRRRDFLCSSVPPTFRLSATPNLPFSPWPVSFSFWVKSRLSPLFFSFSFSCFPFRSKNFDPFRFAASGFCASSPPKASKSLPFFLSRHRAPRLLQSLSPEHPKNDPQKAPPPSPKDLAPLFRKFRLSGLQACFLNAPRQKYTVPRPFSLTLFPFFTLC